MFIDILMSAALASPSSNYCTKSSSIYYAILNLTTPQIKVTKAKIPLITLVKALTNGNSAMMTTPQWALQIKSTQ